MYLEKSGLLQSWKQQLSVKALNKLYDLLLIKDFVASFLNFSAGSISSQWIIPPFTENKFQRKIPPAGYP